MKKSVPFNKDIQFNSNIYEINSISLEQNLKINSDNTITGELILSGDYKESEDTLKNEPFIYNLPVNIDLDLKYNVENAKLEIDDFNYNIKGNNILEVNIVLCINGIEEIEKIEKEEKIEIIDDYVVEENNNDKREIKKESISKETIPIFDSFTDEDTYVNYHVHIFRENDTIENIIKLYNVSKEELEEYNSMSEITIGSKIIIPNEE